MKYKYGDMVYYVDGDDSEVECYVFEYNKSINKYKLIIKTDSCGEKYVFKDEEQLTQIFPDYWDTIDEYLKKHGKCM